MQTNSILFVCLGNICRSPLAEGVLRKKAEQIGIADQLNIDSAGILSYHQGEQPDKRMLQHAYAKGYILSHKSRPVTYNDFFDFDLIIAMDDSNIDDLREKAPTLEAMNKVHRMSEFFSPSATLDHVPDPFYGGAEGFELAISLIEEACDNIINNFRKQS